MVGLAALKTHYWDLRTEMGAVTWDDVTLRSTTRQWAALKQFFRDRVTLDEAQDAIKTALAAREDNFLRLAKTHIYGNGCSPYLTLLQHAGCAFPDLEALVRRRGLEESLTELARQGVYLTAAEFKGKNDVVRGSLKFHVTRGDFARRDFWPGLMVQSSGTSNKPQTGHVALDWIAIWTYAKGLLLAAHDLFSCSHAVYDNILPAPAATYGLLQNAKLGVVTDRWFAQRMPANNWITDARIRWATSLMVMAGKRYGPGFPRPEMLGSREFGPVFDWFLRQRQRGNRCCLDVTASNGVRIAKRALDRGISLDGMTFILHGEPFTDGKRAILESAGLAWTTRYSFSIGIQAGQGCANPAHADDVHLNDYMLAAIPRPNPLGIDGTEIRPLLFTTLYPQAALLHLNVENGDYATVEKRDCGCALGEVGLTTHLSRIRSYEKFTAEGWTYVYWDLYDMMDRIFPAEFGGGPGDYQLVEEEDADGLTRLSLLVDPSVGAVDEERVRSRLQDMFDAGQWGNWSVAKAWRGTGTFRVKRDTPRASARGKILPLHLRRPAEDRS